MVEFFLFVLIIFSAIWGSALVYTLLGRLSRRVEPGDRDETVSMLREEMEFLTLRLGRVEEDLQFFKELKAPEEPES